MYDCLNSKHSLSLPRDLKYSNRMNILNVFRSGESYSVNDVATITGISRQTVSKGILFFCQKGILAPLGKGSSTESGGKKPDLYGLSTRKVIMCITMWPNITQISILNMCSSLILQKVFPPIKETSPQSAFSTLGTLIERCIKESKIDRQQFFGVALSTPGTVDYEKQTIRYNSIMPQWGTDIDVKKYLQPHFFKDTLFFIENAGKMTARSLLNDPELLNRRIVTIFSTWGLSACLINKGHILSGRNSLIGEIGHMIISSEQGDLCGCGTRGCFEQLVSAANVEKMLDPLNHRSIHPIPDTEAFFKKLFTDCSLGDPQSIDVVKNLGRLFSIALRNISLLFDPDIIIFEGNYSFANDIFLEQLTDGLRSFKYYPANNLPELRLNQVPLTTLDLLGASISLINLFFDQENLYSSN